MSDIKCPEPQRKSWGLCFKCSEPKPQDCPFRAQVYGKKEREEQKGWKGICSPRCWNAKGTKCKCKCGGRHHKRGRIIDAANKKLSDDFVLNKEGQDFFRALMLNPAIDDCGVDITYEPIMAYEHPDGWRVKGYDKPLWLFIHCPKCGYDHSLWKLGVDREATNMEVQK